MDELRRSLGRQATTRLELPSRLSFDLPQKVGLDFAHAFNVRLVKQTTANWEFMYGLLETFIKREGDALVPAKHQEGEFKLGSWVSNQYHLKKNGTLSKDRIQRLEALPGWVWNRMDADAHWEEAYALLQAYVAREGDALIPMRHKEDGFSLGAWVNIQRHAKKNGTLSKDRIERLEALDGWDWNPLEAAWEKAFALLEAYVKREGDALVPTNHKEDGFKLGMWVLHQRHAKRKGKLSEDRIKRLEALPKWSWDLRKK